MWSREKEQSFLEASRNNDHMPWSPRRLEPCRRSIHLSLSENASRMCPCAPLLTYLLDSRFCYLLCNPFEIIYFFLKALRHFYLRGPLTLAKELIICFLHWECHNQNRDGMVNQKETSLKRDLESSL